MAGDDDYIDGILDGYGKKTLAEEMEENRKLRKELWQEQVAAYEAEAADRAGGKLDTGAANDKLDRLLEGDDYRVPDDIFASYLAATGEERPRPYRHREPTEEDAGMELLEERYEQWAERAHGIGSPEQLQEFRRLHRFAGASTEGIDVSAEAVYRFARTHAFAGSDGLWLSRLMERSWDGLFLLPGMQGVDYVAAENSKTVLVDGDVGGEAGYRMRDGLLCVKGEAGDRFAARMAGGTAIANRGVGEAPGDGMKGGELVVPDPGVVAVEGKGGRVAGLPRDAF